MKKEKFFIISIIVCKVGIFLWELTLGQANFVKGFWGFTGGDWITYLEPIENLIQKGSYTPDGRMPGYGIIILLPRLLASRAVALDIVIVLQLITGIASTIALGEVARMCFKSRRAFIYVTILYTICISVSINDAFISSESFAISFAIISVYFLLRQKETGKNYMLVISGLFITWSVFVRPVMILLFFAEVLYGLLTFRPILKPESIKALFLMGIAFAITDGAWISRNYLVHKEFTPLASKELYLSDPNQISGDISHFIYDFMEAWGGDIIGWNPNAEIRWFGFRENQVNNLHLADNINDKNLEPPSYIYTSKFNRDSLLSLKDMILKVLNSPLREDSVLHYNTMINSRLIVYTKSIKEEKPFVYYVIAPLRIARKLLVKPGTSVLFGKPFAALQWYDKGIKIFESLLNPSIMIMGFIAMIVSLFRREFMKIFVPSLFVISYILFLCLFFRSSEERFLMPLYPFLLVCSAYLLPFFVKGQKFFFAGGR